MEKETEKYIAYVRGLYEEAEHDRKAIASAGPVTYHLQLVHGCNRGTSLRSMIYDWYQYDLGVKRIIPGDNPGITVRVLKELLLMKIMVSACLAGENCKYNGGNNRSERVLQLMQNNEVIAVCPEQMGGLLTPRIPAEIKDGVVTARDGRIVDPEFRSGAEKCLEIARQEQPGLIVLQSRSPSCGVKQRYDGTFTGTLVEGSGVTAQLLMENGFRVVDAEDL